jgi:hypothetical protein
MRDRLGIHFADAQTDHQLQKKRCRFVVTLDSVMHQSLNQNLTLGASNSPAMFGDGYKLSRFALEEAPQTSPVPGTPFGVSALATLETRIAGRITACAVRS